MLIWIHWESIHLPESTPMSLKRWTWEGTQIFINIYISLENRYYIHSMPTKWGRYTVSVYPKWGDILALYISSVEIHSFNTCHVEIYFGSECRKWRDIFIHCLVLTFWFYVSQGGRYFGFVSNGEIHSFWFCISLKGRYINSMPAKWGDILILYIWSRLILWFCVS